MAAGAFGSTVWRPERLTPDADAVAQIELMLHPSQPQEGPIGLRQPKEIKRLRITKIVTEEGCGFWHNCPDDQGWCGNGVIESGEECDDSNAVDGDGCSSTCRDERKMPKIAVIAPVVLQQLQVSGDRRILPSPATQTQMRRDGRTSSILSVKLCLSPDGAVASAAILMSSRYKAYDSAVLSAVRTWRYRPYMIGGVAVPVCSALTFRYATQ